MEALGKASAYDLKNGWWLFRGNGANARTQSKSKQLRAADRRPEEAWGSFPGKISSPHYFCPISFRLSLFLQ